MKDIILAGRYGIHLWPLSYAPMQKQFVKLFESQSLFEKIIDYVSIKQRLEMESK